MDITHAIKINSLSKSYRLYHRPTDRLKEALDILQRKFHRDFFALKDMSLEVAKGQTFGIIGRNGSGKSTLLKIICGIITPTQGAVEVSGRISALLELGVGFNPQMTGIENIYLNGTLMGYSRQEIDAKIEEIIGFADIGEFIHQPVRTYSSGMFVRLAFALAINVDPDILIIDESLSVGDIRFQQKCFRKIREFQDQGKTIIIVSHDMGAVNNLCTSTVWLKDGQVFKSGNPEEVTRAYISYMAYDSPTTRPCAKGSPVEGALSGKLLWKDVSHCSSFGDRGAQIRRVSFYEAGTKMNIEVLKGGEDACFSLDIEAKTDIAQPIYGFILKDEYENKLIGINSYIYPVNVRPLRAHETTVVDFHFKFPYLKNGFYTFSPAIAEGTQDNHIQHHWVHDALVIQVLNNDLKHKIGCYLIIEKADIQTRQESK